MYDQVGISCTVLSVDQVDHGFPQIIYLITSRCWQERKEIQLINPFGHFGTRYSWGIRSLDQRWMEDRKYGAY